MTMQPRSRPAAPLKTALGASVLLALVACSSDDDGDTAAPPLAGPPGSEVPDGDAAVGTLSVVLDAAQERPVPVGVPDGASGNGTVEVAADGKLTAQIGVSNLSGPATMAHIHRGFEGSTGPILIALSSSDDGNTWSVPEQAPALSADQIAAFLRGELYFNVHTDANPAGEIRGQIDPGNAARFLVRLENVSTATTLNVASDSSAQPVPLSPGVFIVHRGDQNPLVLPLDAANPPLESVAEDGNPAPTVETAYPVVVPGATVFNTPAGAEEPGPIGPGAAYEFTVQALDGDKLGLVTMFIPSNDWFYAPTDEDNSIDLFENGEPVSGDVSAAMQIWDAGTEVDEEPGAGPSQVQRQGEQPNVGAADPDPRVATLSERGQSQPDLTGPVLRLTITPVP